MEKVFRNIIRGPAGWVNSLLAPARDPRVVFAEADHRHSELVEKVRRARAGVARSKKRLTANAEEARRQLSRLEQQTREANSAGQQVLARFATELREAAAEELSTLEQHIRELEQEEELLALAGRRLASEIEGHLARKHAAEGRDYSAQAHAHAREALGSVSEELTRLDEALEDAQQRAERMEDRASAIGNVMGLGVLRGAGRAGADPARRLVRRYTVEAGNDQPPAYRKQLDGGLKALQALAYEYEQLRPVLQRRATADPLSVAYIPALAEETYRQGLSVLENALELTKTVHSPDRARLEADIPDLEKEIESLTANGSEAVRIRIRQDTVASHRQRLAMLERHEASLDDLLHQAGRCEATLHRTRVELTGLRTSNQETAVSAATESLRTAIDQANEVREELKALGL